MRIFLREMCFKNLCNFCIIFVLAGGVMNVPPLILNNYFTILKGVAILNTPYDQNDKVGSWLDCAIRCPVTSGCAAVNYNSTESTCYFYDWSSVSVEMISGKGQTSMAVNTGALMIHVTGSEQLTFGRAESLCQDFGAELASVADLYNARDSGYDLCRCGWVADGSIRFVIQYERPECDSYSSGVISCKDMTSASDVYCKFA